MDHLRKAWKLEEYVAHSPGQVTCLSFGRKQARVMATGGEDKKVNLWAVGKPSCIMSLAGHTSPVEVVEFNPEENKVAAGSQSGSIRIWDLEEVKIVRTLSGHKAAVKSIDFHPYANFIATGSVDSTIKLWDIDRKGCIYTYHGHTGPINVLRFSPDGRWVVSGSDDGLVKLWDLEAGKLLTEFNHHSGPVLSLAFHPNVLLLATSSADRTVKLFDLENFGLANSTLETDAPTAIKRVAFHPDGNSIYGATGDLLKIYGPEPTTSLETVAVGWRCPSVADMAISPSFNQLLGATISQSVVCTYVVDIKSCAPFVEPAANSEPHKVAKSDRPNTTTSRKNYEKSSPNKSIREQSDQDIADLSNINDNNQNEPSEIKDASEYQRIFRPIRTLTRSPTEAIDKAADEKPFSPPNEVAQPQKPKDKPPVTAVVGPVQQEPGRNQKAAVPVAPNVGGGTYRRPFTQAGDSVTARGDQKSSPPAVAKTDDDDCLVRAEDFLPKAGDLVGRCLLADDKSLNKNQPENSLPESEILGRLKKPHGNVKNALKARHRNLNVVRSIWSVENVSNSVDTAISSGDKGLIIDILCTLQQNKTLWTLDLVCQVLPSIVDLTNSKYPRYVECAVECVRLILTLYARNIREYVNLDRGIGVDIEMEERKRKYVSCYSNLTEVRRLLETNEVMAKAGSHGKETLLRLQTL